MKEKKCCFHCLHCKPKEGRYICTFIGVQLKAPFEYACKHFVCFQCNKHNREKCECYEEMK